MDPLLLVSGGTQSCHILRNTTTTTTTMYILYPPRPSPTPPLRTLSPPKLQFHPRLNPIPNRLANLAVSEPPIPLNSQTLHAGAPPPHLVRHCLPIPADIKTPHLSKQLHGIIPLIIPELPRLPGCKHTNHTVPIVRLELLNAIND